MFSAMSNSSAGPSSMHYGIAAHGTNHVSRDGHGSRGPMQTQHTGGTAVITAGSEHGHSTSAGPGLMRSQTLHAAFSSDTDQLLGHSMHSAHSGAWSVPGTVFNTGSLGETVHSAISQAGQSLDWAVPTEGVTRAAAVTGSMVNMSSSKGVTGKVRIGVASSGMCEETLHPGIELRDVAPNPLLGAGHMMGAAPATAYVKSWV